MADKRFLGMQYPLVTTPRGTLAQKTGIDQIKADLLQLILTNPGERVMMPNYGTPLRKLHFEPNDPELEVTAKKMIADSIQMWEPRIVVDSIYVTSQFPSSALNASDPGEDTQHIIGIKISFYDPQDISTVNVLQFEIPISGA